MKADKVRRHVRCHQTKLLHGLSMQKAQGARCRKKIRGGRCQTRRAIKQRTQAGAQFRRVRVCQCWPICQHSLAIRTQQGCIHTVKRGAAHQPNNIQRGKTDTP
jgi:hypothetical protein